MFLTKFSQVEVGAKGFTANKHQGVRAALCWEQEIAELARKHNDANVICIPARFVRDGDAEKMLDIFMNNSNGEIFPQMGFCFH